METKLEFLARTRISERVYDGLISSGVDEDLLIPKKYQKWDFNSSELDNLEETVERMWVSSKEVGVSLITDTDIDGLSARVIARLYNGLVKDNIEIFAAENSRVRGLSREDILRASNKLIVTADNGSDSIKEIDQSKKNPKDIIITDHHNVEDPEGFRERGVAVVNPSPTWNSKDVPQISGGSVIGEIFLKLIDRFQEENPNFSIEAIGRVKSQMKQVMYFSNQADLVKVDTKFLAVAQLRERYSSTIVELNKYFIPEKTQRSLELQEEIVLSMIKGTRLPREIKEEVEKQKFLMNDKRNQILSGDDDSIRDYHGDNFTVRVIDPKSKYSPKELSRRSPILTENHIWIKGDSTGGRMSIEGGKERLKGIQGFNFKGHPSAFGGKVDTSSVIDGDELVKKIALEIKRTEGLYKNGQIKKRMSIEGGKERLKGIQGFNFKGHPSAFGGKVDTSSVIDGDELVKKIALEIKRTEGLYKNGQIKKGSQGVEKGNQGVEKGNQEEEVNIEEEVNKDEIIEVEDGKSLEEVLDTLVKLGLNTMHHQDIEVMIKATGEMALKEGSGYGVTKITYGQESLIYPKGVKKDENLIFSVSGKSLFFKRKATESDKQAAKKYKTADPKTMELGTRLDEMEQIEKGVYYSKSTVKEELELAFGAIKEEDILEYQVKWDNLITLSYDIEGSGTNIYNEGIKAQHPDGTIEKLEFFRNDKEISVQSENLTGITNDFLKKRGGVIPEDRIIRFIKKLKRENPDKKFLFTGHNIFGYDLKQEMTLKLSEYLIKESSVEVYDTMPHIKEAYSNFGGLEILNPITKKKIFVQDNIERGVNIVAFLESWTKGVMPNIKTNAYFEIRENGDLYHNRELFCKEKNKGSLKIKKQQNNKGVRYSVDKMLKENSIYHTIVGGSKSKESVLIPNIPERTPGFLELVDLMKNWDFTKPKQKNISMWGYDFTKDELLIIDEFEGLNGDKLEQQTEITIASFLIANNYITNFNLATKTNNELNEIASSISSKTRITREMVLRILEKFRKEIRVNGDLLKDEDHTALSDAIKENFVTTRTMNRYGTNPTKEEYKTGKAKLKEVVREAKIKLSKNVKNKSFKTSKKSGNHPKPKF